MKKKIISGMLAAALLVGSFPATVMAADSPTTINSDILDFRNQLDDVINHVIGYEWDANSQILTLKNFNIFVPGNALEDEAAIYLPSDSTIIVRGENNKIHTKSSYCDAIYCEGDLSISGDGLLKIETESIGSSAIFVEKGPLTLDGEVEVSVKPAGYVVYLEYVSGPNAVFTIDDDAKISFPITKSGRHVQLVHKSTVEKNEDWIDFAQTTNVFNRTVELVAKSAIPESENELLVHKKPETPAEPELPEESEFPVESTAPVETMGTYQISIGDVVIMKDGEPFYRSDAAPYLSNGYTMLPLRALLEVTNPELNIKWNTATKSAYTFIDNQLVTIKPGETTYKKSTETIELATPAETRNGRLFISLRDWMNIMGISDSQLHWDRNTKTATMPY